MPAAGRPPPASGTPLVGRALLVVAPAVLAAAALRPGGSGGSGGSRSRATG
ncbi:hypothetical protein GCM10027160_44800 [Streptomyces calidiresistens]